MWRNADNCNSTWAIFQSRVRSMGIWIKYLTHTSTGSKMSKSLKNFQTIQDALATTYTARNMRIVFLMGRWNDGVEISPDMRKQADNWESTIDVSPPVVIPLNMADPRRISSQTPRPSSPRPAPPPKASRTCPWTTARQTRLSSSWGRPRRTSMRPCATRSIPPARCRSSCASSATPTST